MPRDLTAFVAAVLESEGAASERLSGGATLAVLPESLAARLRLPEEYRFRGEGVEDRDGELVAYGTETLARVAELACARGRTAHAVLPVSYLKKADLEPMAAEVFQISRASREFVGSEEAIVSYLAVHVHYAVRSVETREGLDYVVLNERSGARLEGLGELSGLEDAGAEEEVEGRMAVTALLDRVKAIVRSDLEQRISEFRAAMQKRLARDWRRVNEYYSQMRGETIARLRRSHREEARARGNERLAAIGADLEAKRRDLIARYAIRVDLEVASALRLYALALKVTWRLKLRGAERTVSTFWNPFTRSVEQLFCEACSRTATAFVTCDRLHMVCSACSGSCPSCGRRICRACDSRGCAACAGPR